ncbi:MAG: hypothetical protein IJG63_08280 [Oscillospiraceae bacterium]|nr:hypothetical protein [Oscillospiraceae bacterium]
MNYGDILNRYGEEALLCTGGETKTIKVFINPIITNRSDKTWSGTLPVGEVDKSRWYCFGPPDCPVDDCENSYLLKGDDSFDFVRAEMYTVEGAPDHWEAVLRVRNRND